MRKSKRSVVPREDPRAENVPMEFKLNGRPSHGRISNMHKMVKFCRKVFKLWERTDRQT